MKTKSLIIPAILSLATFPSSIISCSSLNSPKKNLIDKLHEDAQRLTINYNSSVEIAQKNNVLTNYPALNATHDNFVGTLQLSNYLFSLIFNKTLDLNIKITRLNEFINNNNSYYNQIISWREQRENKDLKEIYKGNFSPPSWYKLKKEYNDFLEIYNDKYKYFSESRMLNDDLNNLDGLIKETISLENVDYLYGNTILYLTFNVDEYILTMLSLLNKIAKLHILIYKNIDLFKTEQTIKQFYNLAKEAIEDLLKSNNKEDNGDFINLLGVSKFNNFIQLNDKNEIQNYFWFSIEKSNIIPAIDFNNNLYLYKNLIGPLYWIKNNQKWADNNLKGYKYYNKYLFNQKDNLSNITIYDLQNTETELETIKQYINLIN